MDNREICDLHYMLEGKVNGNVIGQAAEIMTKKDPYKSLMSIGLIDFHDRHTMILLSVFLGSLGLDRFYLGDTKKGIIKLVYCVLSSFVLMASLTSSIVLISMNLINDFFSYGAVPNTELNPEIATGLAIGMIVGQVLTIISLIYVVVDGVLCYKKSQMLNEKNILNALNNLDDVDNESI